MDISFTFTHSIFIVRPLNQTMSWEPPPTQPQRSMSCDTTGSDPMAMNFTLGGGIGAHLVDDMQPHGLQSSGAAAAAAATAATGISSSSSEHDNHEASTWSSDYSNSEDECSQVGIGPAADNAILVSDFFRYSSTCSIP